jgi:RNA polymerase sigma-70 factor (ECF subfamily)
VLQLVPRIPSQIPPASAPTEPDDERAVRDALDGDRDAFEALYRRHATFAINLAVRLQGNRSDVEDLVHDAFLKAFQRLPELRDRAAFRPWLGSIVVSLLRTRIRRARWFYGLSSLLGTTNSVTARSAQAGRDVVDIDSLASDSAGPDVRAELAQVYALLRLLPPDERIAWTLRAVERHRLETVAELTQCSLATVKRRIQRAQRFLDEHYVHADSSESPAREGAPNDDSTSGDEPQVQSSRVAERPDADPQSARVSRRRTRRSS